MPAANVIQLNHFKLNQVYHKYIQWTVTVQLHQSFFCHLFQNLTMGSAVRRSFLCIPRTATRDTLKEASAAEQNTRCHSWETVDVSLISDWTLFSCQKKKEHAWETDLLVSWTWKWWQRGYKLLVWTVMVSSIWPIGSSVFKITLLLTWELYVTYCCV